MGVWTLTIRLMTIPCYMEIMWVLTLTHLKQQLGLRNLVWNLSIPATVFNNEYTPWKINMEPETDGLEDDFPFQLGDF